MEIIEVNFRKRRRTIRVTLPKVALPDFVFEGSNELPQPVVRHWKDYEKLVESFRQLG